MRVATHVIQNLLGSGEGPLGVHDPLTSLHPLETLNEGVPVTEGFQGMEELEFSGIERRLQRFQEEPAKQTGQNSDGKKETRLAGDPALAVG